MLVLPVLLSLAAPATTLPAPGGAWTAIAPDGAPTPRHEPTAVWTGREMIVWGGWNPDPAREGWCTFVGDGAAYDPSGDRWRSLPVDGAPSARAWHSAVWTGDEMIVWGGESGEPIFGDGAAYDPALHRWRPIARAGAPSPRVEHRAVWTGREMIVFGGVTDERSFVDGGRYDPAEDRWRPLPPADGLTGCRAHGAVWTGRELIVFGGINGARSLRQGAAYDPDEDRWRPISMEDAPSARGYPGMVWTGDRVVVFGGQEGFVSGPGVATGASYDPDADRWTPLPTAGAPPPRMHHACVWTGSRLLVVGGTEGVRGGRDLVHSDAASLELATGEWSAFAGPSERGARHSCAAAWTGEALLVFGGSVDDRALDGGARFRPAER